LAASTNRCLGVTLMPQRDSRLGHETEQRRRMITKAVAELPKEFEI